MSLTNTKTRKARVQQSKSGGNHSGDDSDSTLNKNHGLEDFFWLLGYAKSFWILFAAVLLFSFISTASRTGMVYFIKPYVDGVIGEGGDLGKLQQVAIGVTILALIAGVTQFFFLYLSRKVREKIMVEMRADVFGHLLDLPLSFYSTRKRGDLISRVTNDIQVARQALHSILTKILKEPLIALFAIGYMFYASYELTIVALLIAPLIIIPLRYFASRVKSNKKQSLLKLGDIVESLNQMLSGIRVVRIFQAEENEQKYFREKNESLLRKNLKVIKNKALSRSLLRLTIGLMLAGFIFGGTWLVISPSTPVNLSKGDLFMFLGALWFLYQPVRKTTKTYNRLQETLAGVRRIREVLSEDHKSENVPDGSRVIDGIYDRISIQDISFAYDTEPVLKDLNLDINQGDVVALVGPSGAGKSTLMDIVARFYHPQKGTITVDGVPMEEIDMDSYIEQISIVSQDAFLFNTTIRENIRYGNPDATDEQVEEAARMAYIHDYIASLSDGYETNVGERGIRLSGGQKQRITIARAILEDPELLLLDEATSDLDTQSEQMIQKAMNSLLEGRTCVVIAHRLSTIQDADHIVVLEDGRIVQEGTHSQLIETDGLYKNLYESQFDRTDKRA